MHFHNAASLAADAFTTGGYENLEIVSRCMSRMSELLVQAEAKMISDSREHVARHEDRRRG
jgi:hypothetical protein